MSPEFIVKFKEERKEYIQGNSLIKDLSELYLVESEKLSLGGSRNK